MTEKVTKTKHIRQKLESLNSQQPPEKRLQGIKSARKKYQGLGLNWRDAVILIWLLFFVGLYQVQAYAQNHIPLDEIDTGMMLSYDEQTDHYSPLTLLSSDYDVEIAGIIAQVTIKQTFYNANTDWINKGVYAFPLASNAAVDGMEMRLGKRVIVAEIHEKQQAQQIYDNAVAQGQSASIVKQYRPNLFTTGVANIKPFETIEVQISYQQTLRYDAGHIDFRLPLTIKSRYMQETFLVDASPHNSPQETHPPVTSVSKEKQRKINVNLSAGFELSGLKSLNHDVKIDNHTNQQFIALVDQTMYDNHDFVLRWYPKKTQQPQAAMFSEKIDGTEYALLMLLPPQQSTSETSTQNREVIFIIDTSGSMHGQALDAAKDALLFGLTQLGEQDKFNIVEFNTYAQSLFEKSVNSNADHLDQAIDFIDGLAANGGTNMGPALSFAMQSPETADLLKQIIFITDGSVGNEAELFKSINHQIDKARLFTVAIGDAPNNYFMEKAATVGRGSYTNIAQLKHVDEQMNDLFVKLKSPALTNVMVDWGAKNVEQSPAVIPDLYSNEAVIVTAKMTDFDAKAVLSGYADQLVWSSDFSFNHDGQSAGVGRLWARQYIEQLTDDLMLGADEDELWLKDTITEVALAFHLVSDFTSLVAVDQTPQVSKMLVDQRSAIQRPRVVAQAQYPQTALGWRLQLLIGMVLMMVALGLKQWR